MYENEFYKKKVGAKDRIEITLKKVRIKEIQGKTIINNKSKEAAATSQLDTLALRVNSVEKKKKKKTKRLCLIYRNGVSGGRTCCRERAGTDDRDDGHESNVRGRSRAGENGLGSVHGNPHHGLGSSSQRLASDGLADTNLFNCPSLPVRSDDTRAAGDGQPEAVQTQGNFGSVQRVSSSLLVRDAVRGKRLDR